MTVVRLYYGGSGEIECEAFQTKADVHFEYYEDSTYGERIRITGDTYPVKELIKAPPKDKTGRYWNGNVWEARASATALLAEALMEKLPSVTADIEAIEADDSLPEYHGEFEHDDEEEVEMVMAVNEDEGRYVMDEEMAKDVAELGNFDEVSDILRDVDVVVPEPDDVRDYVDGDDGEWDVTAYEK